MADIVDVTGRVIRHSRNLRGLVTHMGVELVREVRIDRSSDGEGGELFVLFENDDRCKTKFADYTVLSQWVHARRNLQGVKLIACGVESVI